MKVEWINRIFIINIEIINYRMKGRSINNEISKINNISLIFIIFIIENSFLITIFFLIILNKVQHNRQN